MKISIIRGAFLNPFELQNYYPLSKKCQLKCVSSMFPISTNIKLPLTRLWSPTDLPLPFKYQTLNRLLWDAHYLLGLEAAIKGSDIAHVAETYCHYTLQAIRAKRKGLVKKVVSAVWEVVPHNNETLAGRRRIKGLARQEIDHFIVVTQVAKNALIEEGIAPDRISVIPVGVDLTRFRPVKKIRQKPLRLLFIGRLVPESTTPTAKPTFFVYPVSPPPPGKNNMGWYWSKPLPADCRSSPPINRQPGKSATIAPSMPYRATVFN